MFQRKKKAKKYYYLVAGLKKNQIEKINSIVNIFFSKLNLSIKKNYKI